MLYQADITIPKNTTEPNATVVMLKIAKGIITKIMVRPRPGHAALAHLVILHHEHQIAPSTPNMDFHGDAFPIDWEEYLKSDQPPFELKLKGWNDDDTYPHTFDVFVAVMQREGVIAFGYNRCYQGIMGYAIAKAYLYRRGLNGTRAA